MSQEQLKAFFEKVKSDSSLQEKLKVAKLPEDVAGIAKEHGHVFLKNQFPLSAKELEAVAGGDGQDLGTTTYVLATYCAPGM